LWKYPRRPQIIQKEKKSNTIARDNNRTQQKQHGFKIKSELVQYCPQPELSMEENGKLTEIKLLYKFPNKI
jgi:hypothetical protein